MLEGFQCPQKNVSPFSCNPTIHFFFLDPGHHLPTFCLYIFAYSCGHNCGILKFDIIFIFTYPTIKLAFQITLDISSGLFVYDYILKNIFHIIYMQYSFRDHIIYLDLLVIYSKIININIGYSTCKNAITLKGSIN